MKIKREKLHNLRDVYPVKLYSDGGFIETKFEIKEIIEYYLRDHVEFGFDEVEIVNNRPMNTWLYAKCRKYIDPDDPDGDEDTDYPEVQIKGKYEDDSDNKEVY